MKTQPTILLFLLLPFFVVSQDCDETTTKTLIGNIYDYQLEDCTGDVEIVSSNEDTNIHGITFIDAVYSINLKPTGENKIIIKPDDSLDFIDLMVRETTLSLEEHLQARVQGDINSRTDGGNPDSEPKNYQIIMYPNPVESSLYISTGFTILNYKILNLYGFTVMEGNTPKSGLPASSYELVLDSLSEGMYYIIIQTEENTILGTPYYDTFIGTIYKN